MATTIIQREHTISIPELSFRDFWDICSCFQTVHPEYRHVYFWVDGDSDIIALNEPNVANVLSKLEGQEDRVRKYSARFFSNREECSESRSIAELHYRPIAQGHELQGLHFYSDSIDKVSHYQFEEDLYNHYPIIQRISPEVEFGKPCEVLALVIDIRGFSLFCEDPTIESPYTCGLMSAFTAWSDNYSIASHRS